MAPKNITKIWNYLILIYQNMKFIINNILGYD
jgi:hypothetical protein